MIATACNQSNAFWNSQTGRVCPCEEGKALFSERQEEVKVCCFSWAFEIRRSCLGRIAPSATKAARFRFSSSFRTNIWSSARKYLFYRFLIQIFIIQSFLYTYRKKIKKNFFQFKGIDGSAVCRKSYSKTHNQFFCSNLYRQCVQNFLSAVRGGNQTAFA